MPADRERVQQVFSGLLKKFTSLDALLERFTSPNKPIPQSIPRTETWSAEEAQSRVNFIKAQGTDLPYLSGEKRFTDVESLRGNIENFVGFTQVPTGIAGPIRINGLHANGDFYIPLATSEGALVASISRGCSIITHSGGARTLTVNESVSRAPVFVFENLVQASIFVQWTTSQFDRLKEIVESVSKHAKLLDVSSTLIANQVHLIFSYSTGDASGQNMVTICSDAICQYLNKESPEKPRYWFIEGNLSGDKKPTAISFLTSRGKKVTAEVEIPKELCDKALHTSPTRIFDYWKTSFVGGVQSGSIGVCGHYANALAAIYLACGQDVACVGESCVGITVIDVLPNGNLYVSVTLPNLIVGTIGGGTALATQKECLKMLGCDGLDKAKTFAEICAAAVLAGEISISGALAAGHFTSAHASFGRKPANPRIAP